MFVKFRHAIALRVVDVVAEDGSLSVLLGVMDRLFQHAGEAAAIENVVAQDQAGAVVAYELLANDESLSQSVGRGLLGVLEAHAQLRAVAQQPTEAGQVVGCRDNQYLADAGQHQRRDRIVNHRLVENGNELFRHTFCDGVEACSAASS